jgi:cell division protease FtsH
MIDEEARQIVEEQHRRATDIINEKRKILDALAKLLEEKEVISGEEVEELIKKIETAA